MQTEPVMLFETDRTKLLALPADGPRGARLLLRVGDDGDAREDTLLEGEANQLHLIIRQWRRQQKSLRGETPRGKRHFEIRAGQYRAPRPAGAGAAP